METVKLAKAEEAKKESDSKAEQLQKTFHLLQQGETKANEREKETKMYLDMQVSHPPRRRIPIYDHEDIITYSITTLN